MIHEKQEDGTALGDAMTAWHELSPGGWAIMPPQKVAVKITALDGGGCRIEAVSTEEPG